MVPEAEIRQPEIPTCRAQLFWISGLLKFGIFCPDPFCHEIEMNCFIQKKIVPYCLRVEQSGSKK